MKRRIALAVIATTASLFAASCSTTGRSGTPAPLAEQRSIDAQVDAALSKLIAQVPQAGDLVSSAKGVLVFPDVVSAGLVVGGSYGKGALRIAGKTSDYYSTTAASVGLLAGAQSKAMYLLFMTQEALDKFVASKGWTAGVDASVAILSVGASADVTSKTIRHAIIGYALTNNGLMANLSLDGTKFTKLEM